MATIDWTKFSGRCFGAIALSSQRAREASGRRSMETPDGVLHLKLVVADYVGVLYYRYRYRCRYTVKLGWGFVKLIARKTNERFRSLRYSLHAEGGWLCMQHPGPRNVAAILEAFPSSGNIAAPFLGQVFGAIFGTTKGQTEAARWSWRPGFRPFAGTSLPSATQAAMDTHTHIRIILWGDMAQKLFWISEKSPLSGAAEAMRTFCALAACRLYNAYVRKLFCVHLGRSVWRAIVAVHPVRAL